MVNEKTVKKFWIRLNHSGLGFTELAAFDKDRGKLVATGFFDNMDDFAFACRTLNEQCNVYAGRNPRPWGMACIRNALDKVQRKRAKDRDISLITAISLDIDPIRKKGMASTPRQHDQAMDFALKLQSEIGGGVDDSGNGAYLWISFKTPIEITSFNFNIEKKRCALWQEQVMKRFDPEKWGLKIDGCFDFSRLKRVIGTFNHKAQRSSRFVKKGRPGDGVRDEICSIKIDDQKRRKFGKIPIPPLIPLALPDVFKALLGWDISIRGLWGKPDPFNDTSRHDWILGMSCVEAGITNPKDLAAILMQNPFGKFRRDGRLGYVEGTVGKLLGLV
jgi:hypothetical protein